MIGGDLRAEHPRCGNEHDAFFVGLKMDVEAPRSMATLRVFWQTYHRCFINRHVTAAARFIDVQRPLVTNGWHKASWVTSAAGVDLSPV
jgi:hypothetical protein